MKFAKIKKLIVATLALSMVMTSSVAVFAEPTDGVVEEAVEEVVETDAVVEADVDTVDEVVDDEIQDVEEVSEIATLSANAILADDITGEIADFNLGIERPNGHIGLGLGEGTSLSDVAKGDEGLVGDVGRIPSVYVVDYDKISYLRDQAIFGTCWAHGAMSSVESNAIVKGYFDKDTANFSEFHLATTRHHSTNEGALMSSDDTNYTNEDYISNHVSSDIDDKSFFPDVEDVDIIGGLVAGAPDFGENNFIKTPSGINNFKGYDYLVGGEFFSSARAFASWQGPVSEEYATYPTNATWSSGTDVHNSVYIDYSNRNEKIANFIKATNLYQDATTKVDDITYIIDEDKYNLAMHYYSNMLGVNKANFYRDNIYADITNANHARDTFLEEDDVERALTVINTDVIYSLKTPEDMNKLKNLIMTRGVCDISYYAADEDKNAQEALQKFSSGYSYFCPTIHNANHEVAVVGWDDNYPKSNFNNSGKIKNNGAWLFKNSWKLDDDQYPVKRSDSGHGDYRDDREHIDVLDTTGEKGDYEGFFWISYEDPNICEAASYEVAPNDGYDNNYFYDGGLVTWNIEGQDDITVANVFEAQNPLDNYKEVLHSVNIATATPNVNVTVKIFKNPTADDPSTGALVSKTNKFIECYGVHTIKLDDGVYLDDGDRYAVVVEVEKKGYETKFCMEVGIDEGLSVNANSNESFIFGAKANQFAKTTWEDFGEITNSNLCIKAYTENDSDVNDYRSIYYNVPYGYVDSTGDKNPYCYDLDDGFAPFKLSDPIMEQGAVFKGWYADATYKTPISSVTEDLADDYGDIVVYAKVDLNDAYMYEAARNKGYSSITDTATLSDDISGKTTVNKGAKKLQLKGEKGTFKSSNPKVVAVNKKSGKLTFKKPGEADITYKSVGGVEVTKHIVVQEPKVPKLSKAEKTVKVGESKTLSFDTKDFNMINAEWKVKGKKPKVDIKPSADRQSVVVTGKVKGSATITATINGKAYNFKVKVVK